MASDKWVVDIKGGAYSDAFEISLVRDSFKHGKSSYGWFGADKLLVSHSGGPCRNQVTKTVWDKLVQLAHDTAGEMNEALDIVREG